MDTQSHIDATGLFDARYSAFLETIVHLRTRLHRYCARMTGSVLDGEDVMQEAVFEAYRKLDLFDDSRDVFDYSIDEIADMVDSTVGDVKAALSRGRTKLATLNESSDAKLLTRPEAPELLRLYVDRFNRCDWDAVRELASADSICRWPP